MAAKQKVVNVKVLDVADLSDIRQRLGAERGSDTTYDAKINAMSAEQLVSLKSGWELGDESWAESYIEIYRQLVKRGVRTEPISD